ncbi:hypothetical protein CLV51_104398 [Chitinophaga niastensis]|uniref:Uncharacterized protein n=1 Tax=Chitinophaga niastensis TaxID=536980 RepID=A0A2P8HHL3_CHINA|nr:hypothetical protein [Chitinophaga niastensis]PSL45691.1 hypothetical protein CLV51_104398 [Chitinophaga niastensis]
MKKARIILAAIAVVAIVGGGLAVKAHTFGARIFCSTVASQNCPLLVPNKTITTLTSAPVSFCTDNTITGNCLFTTHVTVKQ